MTSRDIGSPRPVSSDLARFDLAGMHFLKIFPLPPQWSPRSPFVTADPDSMMFSTMTGPRADLDRRSTLHEVFDGFLALANAPVEQIFEFAGRWGQLNICVTHGLPPRHAEASVYDRLSRVDAEHKLLLRESERTPTDDETRHNLLRELIMATAQGRAVREPLDVCRLGAFEKYEHWRRIAAHFSKIVEAAAFLHVEQIPPLELWTSGQLLSETLVGFDPAQYPRVFGADKKTAVAEMRRVLGYHIDLWLRWCPLAIRCTWDAHAPGAFLAPHVDARLTRGNPDGGNLRTEPLLLPLLVLELSSVIFDVPSFTGSCRHCAAPLPPNAHGGPRRALCGSPECKKKDEAARQRKSRVKRNIAEKPPSRQSSKPKKRTTKEG